MNYERIVRRLRQDDRLFSTDDDHPIHRVLRRAKAHMLMQRAAARLAEPVGPYSGLTRRELRLTGTCEPDWF